MSHQWWVRSLVPKMEHGSEADFRCVGVGMVLGLVVVGVEQEPE